MNEQIRHATERAISECLGAEATVTGWDAVEERTWSWHLQIQVAGPRGGDFILKIPRWEEVATLEAALIAGEQSATRGEFESLRRIDVAVASSGDPGLTAVEPIAFVTEINGILMRRLEGGSLRERLGIGRGTGEVEALFDRVGRWIRVHHGVEGELERVPFVANGEVTMWRKAEEEIRRSGHIPRGLLPAMALLRLAAEGLNGIGEPHTDIHGDLTASNVLVTPDDRVAVIDSNRVRGPALCDVAHILADIRLDKSQLATAGRMRPETTVAAWERRLIDSAGYRDEPLVGYRLASRAVERWMEIEHDLTGPSRLGLLPGRSLLRRVVSRRLDAVV